ncbi:hypothetical protein L914_17912 [Phytophthora nicotianae]|uniref:Uncharacterized protein n=1 Tax=Phytophthora nicotianae TaxID=4792 RepID=W2MFK6_PHYNI|nr:hypothetical protein L914_17912 [Phytophthora nicotianae]
MAGVVRKDTGVDDERDDRRGDLSVDVEINVSRGESIRSLQCSGKEGESAGNATESEVHEIENDFRGGCGDRASQRADKDDQHDAFRGAGVGRVCGGYDRCGTALAGVAEPVGVDDSEGDAHDSSVAVGTEVSNTRGNSTTGWTGGVASVDRAGMPVGMSRKRSVAAVGDDNNLEDNEREEKTDEGSQCESIPRDVVLENLGLDQPVPVEFDPDLSLRTSLKEVEAVKNMKFDPRIKMEAPTDLYSHDDDSTTTRVRPECTYVFTRSASFSFLAYIPL